MEELDMLQYINVRKHTFLFKIYVFYFVDTPENNRKL